MTPPTYVPEPPHRPDDLTPAGWTTRDATVDDASACAAIYAPYVDDTEITFETVAPTGSEMAVRIAAAQAHHAFVVMEDGEGRVVGYAYGTRFHRRPAYQWTAEVSVYLRMGLRRRGAGRALYTALFDRLARRGYRRLVAVITVPNDPSIALHEAMGFEMTGVVPEVGWKHGAWRDVAWMHRFLGPPGTPPSPLR